MLHFIVAELSGFLKIDNFIKWHGFAGSPLLSGFSSSCGEQRLLSRGGRPSHRGGFSVLGVGARDAGFGGCDPGAQCWRRAGLVALACGISRDQGSNWCLQHWRVGGRTPLCHRDALGPGFNTLQSSSKLWKMIHLLKNICCVSKSIVCQQSLFLELWFSEKRYITHTCRWW